MKILLVGGGITSAVTGACLRKLLPESNITMWDKAKGTGGRMTTSRCDINSNCIADLGAQYITTTDECIKSHRDIYDDLLSEKIIEPLTCKVVGMKPQGSNKNFVVPKGTGFLVKQFFQKAQLNETKFSHHVSSIIREKNKWIVETKQGTKEDFDIVILSMPVPQLFLLDGDVKNELRDVSEQLKAVTYSSRFALILFFFENLNENWGAQYFEDDQVFCYAAIDNTKRNQHQSLCAVVFHTTVRFGLSHIEDSIDNVEKSLLFQVKKLFPLWPEPKSIKCHKWRYSQVTTTFHDSPGCLVISSNPPLLVGGDGFIGSTFDNCVKSSKIICEKVKMFSAM